MLWKPIRAILLSVKYDLRFRDQSFNLDFKLLLEVKLLIRSLITTRNEIINLILNYY